MTEHVDLIIQLPTGSAIDRQLDQDPPSSVINGRAVVQRIAPGPEGTIEPPEAGRVVLTLLSPEALHDADQIRGEILPYDDSEPPVVVLEVAEYLREDELSALLEAVNEAKRVAILCIIGSV